MGRVEAEASGWLGTTSRKSGSFGEKDGDKY